MPNSPPEYGHRVFRFGTHEFSLPLVTPEQFTKDGLLISRFISDMVASNPTKEVHLSPDAIQAAVGEFAIQRFYCSSGASAAIFDAGETGYGVLHHYW